MDYYLIDGYNFLFRLRSGGSTLEKKRETLLRLLNEELSPLRLHLCVIFDGADPIRNYARTLQFETLEIVYTSSHQSADDYVIDKLEHCRHTGHFIVVTSDQGLAKTCKRLGARTLSIEDFVEFLRRRLQKVAHKESKPALHPSNKELDRLLEIFEARLKKADLK